MPAPVFFQQLGLFLVPDFVDQGCAVGFCRKMAAAPVEKAVVLGANGEQLLDLDSRKVDSSILPKEFTYPLKQRLRGIQPDLERHFGMKLAGCEPPQYLVYHPGNFFKAHQDVGDYEVKHATKLRRVSVVIFLNAPSQEPTEGAYGDGQLVFYGLLEGAQWQKCAFPLDAEPGLLVAFPSDKWHEVKPVSHGTRFTVVTWFYGPEIETEVGGEAKSVAPTVVQL
jgi:SM-20-related protein